MQLLQDHSFLFLIIVTIASNKQKALCAPPRFLTALFVDIIENIGEAFMFAKSYGRIECTSCRGSGREACIDCYGRGKTLTAPELPCALCQGRGHNFVTCGVCGGSGAVDDPYPRNPRDIPQPPEIDPGGGESEPKPKPKPAEPEPPSPSPFPEWPWFSGERSKASMSFAPGTKSRSLGPQFYACVLVVIILLSLILLN